MSDFFPFEKLTVYQKALDFSKQTASLLSHINKSHFSWADQLRRASMSVVLNIAEGGGRESTREKVNFYRIARGSVFECIPLFEIGNHLQLLSEKDQQEFRSKCVEIAKMLTALIQTFKDKS